MNDSVGEIDCGWRWQAWPRFQVRVRPNIIVGDWEILEVYTDGRRILIGSCDTKDQAIDIAWAWRAEAE